MASDVDGVERLPDFHRSRAVLIGCATFTAGKAPDVGGLADITQVARNVHRLREILTDPARSGLPDDRCNVTLDPPSQEAALDPLYSAAEDAEDLLLVYFAGHGLLLGNRQDLHFPLPGMTDLRRKYASVAFGDVSDIVMESGAATKIVILDCCYSGRAAMADSVMPAVMGQLEVDGTYILTSTSATRTSLAPEGSEFTAFTGAMIDCMDEGVAGRGPLLSMDAMFLEVRRRMAAGKFPEPQQKGINLAGRMALVRNRHPRAVAPEPTREELWRLWSRLVQQLAALPGMQDPAERQRLMALTGYERVGPAADEGTNPIAFVTAVVDALAARGGGELRDFLDRLTGGVAMGSGARDAVAELRLELGLVDPRSLRAASSGTGPRDLVAAGRTASERAVVDAGPQYRVDLHVARADLEAEFDAFLHGENTCFLIVSAAGRGKTNFLCRLAQLHWDRRPTLLMTAKLPFQDEHGLVRMVSERLGFERDWRACFAELAASRSAGAGPLILIDAINETPAPPEVMKAALSVLLAQSRMAGVRVAVSCRREFWPFYRAPFWQAYTGGADAGGTRMHSLPPFGRDEMTDVVAKYFASFRIRGELSADAREQCRQPLILRLLCEAYAEQTVGTLGDLRLYRMLRHYWERKTGQIAEAAGLRHPDAVTELLLRIVGEMVRNQRTTLTSAEVAAAVGVTPAELDGEGSLYGRVVDEEILREQRTDPHAGVRVTTFAFDQLAEYAFAVRTYADGDWDRRTEGEVRAGIAQLVAAEHTFGSLRGALELLVLRLEDRRPRERLQFAAIRTMLEAGQWRWLQIGTLLTFQLDPAVGEAAYWRFVRTTLMGQKECLPRRLVAENVGRHADRYPDEVFAILDTLLDDTRSVREAARQSVERLPVELGVRFVERLLKEQPHSRRAVELLLSPADGMSPALRGKLAWLVTAGRPYLDREEVLNVLRRPGADVFDAMLDGEEVLEAFREVGAKSVPQRDVNPWQDGLRAIVARQQATIANDLVSISRLFMLMRIALEVTTGRSGPVGAMVHTLATTIVSPAAEARIRVRWNRLGRTGSAELRNERIYSPLPAELRWTDRGDVSALSVAFWLNDELPMPHPAGRASYRRLTDAVRARKAEDVQLLCSVVDAVWSVVTAGWRATIHDLDGPVNLLLELEEPYLYGKPGARGEEAKAAYRRGVLELQESVGAALGMPLSVIDRRRLRSVGRLVLALWQRMLLQEHRSSRLQKLGRQLAAMTAEQVRAELAAIEGRAADDDRSDRLTDFLSATCRGLVSRPAELAELWARFIERQDAAGREALQHQLAELHRRDYKDFWLLAQALLTRPAGVVADVIGEAIEQAERAEQAERGDRDILAGVAEILEQTAGVDRDNAQMHSDLTDDLDLDSLSMVEFIVAVEEKFGIKIDDGLVPALRTVGDLVAEVQRQLSRGAGRTHRPADLAVQSLE